MKINLQPGQLLKRTEEKFEVFCGYQHLMPCVVESSVHRESLVRAMGGVSDADDYFELVPVDLRGQFLKNIYLAIQNHCGRSTVSKGTFVTNYGVVRDSYDASLLSGSPLLQGSVVCSDQDDVPLRVVFDSGRFVDVDRPHALCLDLSLTGDHASLCCVRYDGLVGGVHCHSEVFNLDIVPPSFPGMLRISKVRDLILWLSGELNIGVFSSDAYQSEGLRQDVCSVLGLQNIRLSLDSSDLPALTWLGMLVDRRLRLQFLARQDMEIREAVHDVVRHRVVKRDGGSDDQFQAMCGACFLSETVLARVGCGLGDLVGGGRLNLVGSGNIGRFLGMCGLGGSVLSGGLRGVVDGGVSGVPSGVPSGGGSLGGGSLDGSGVSSGVSGGLSSVIRSRRGGVRGTSLRGVSDGSGWSCRRSDVEGGVRRVGGLVGSILDGLDGLDG